MGIQESILLFCSSVHNGVNVVLADIITTFGTELPIIALLIFIYYSIDKKKGASTCITFMLATNVMGILKAIVKFPRPWTVIDGLDSQSMKGATGYSFPSGHTTCAAVAYSSLSVAFKKKWLSRVCAVTILLVGLSRVFLCVHWPLDVAGGLIVGCGIAFLCTEKFTAFLENEEKSIKTMIPFGIASSVAALVMGILLNKNLIDETAFSDLSKTVASLGGLVMGYSLEVKTFNFKVEEGQWKIKVLRYVLSMIGVLIILPLSKVLLTKINFYNPVTAQLRYFLTGFWVSVFPFFAKKLFSN